MEEHILNAFSIELCYCDEAFMLYDNVAHCKMQTFQEKAFLPQPQISHQ